MEPTNELNNIELKNTQEKFKNYHSQTSQKVDPQKKALLKKNKFKCYKKAFSPIVSQIKVGDKILDFGCGEGDFLYFLNQNLNSNELTGYDVSLDQRENAKKDLAHIKNIKILSDPPKQEQQFDFIFCHHVIEHIPDHEINSFLLNLKKLLKNNGKLILTTPNGLNPFSYTLFMAMDSTHLRMYSVFSLAEVLSRASLKIQSTHRELPQFYDLQTFAKFIVWKIVSFFAKIAVLSHAGGVRGNAFPMDMSSTFYAVCINTDNNKE